MDVQNLIQKYKKHNPDGHFFDKETLKFFGETLSSMYVYKNKEKYTDSLGKEHICWCLRSRQRNHPCGPQNAYHYFDHETFEHII